MTRFLKVVPPYRRDASRGETARAEPVFVNADAIRSIEGCEVTLMDGRVLLGRIAETDDEALAGSTIVPAAPGFIAFDLHVFRAEAESGLGGEVCIDARPVLAWRVLNADIDNPRPVTVATDDGAYAAIMEPSGVVRTVTGDVFESFDAWLAAAVPADVRETARVIVTGVGAGRLGSLAAADEGKKTAAELRPAP